jgi:hypothetical protein
MLGKREPQGDLFDVGNVWPLKLDAASFYGQLAPASSGLFSDEQFAAFYSSKVGRPSVPPSLLALMLLMQTYAGVSDQEAVARATYDARWLCVLRRPLGVPLCAKSTLQAFRSHLVLHDGARSIFEAGLRQARAAGLLGKKVSAAIDTKPIVGRGAVEDTYNLLARGIRQAACALASAAKMKTDKFLSRHSLGRYEAPSIKGTEVLDWSDAVAAREFLSGIVSDAVKVLSLAGESDDEHVKRSAGLLAQLLLQDVEVVKTPDGDKAQLIKGTAPGRVPSATDPEQRHGRKSATKRFTGSKASVATDTASGIILATEVLSGDAGDATGALDLVASAEASGDVKIAETLGDCAYGSGAARQAFADAGRCLIAKVPSAHAQEGRFPKSAFHIDLKQLSVSCPAGVTTRDFQRGQNGAKVFSFGAACSGCALAARCTSSDQGRTVQVHPQEALLNQARSFQESDVGRATLKKRLAVENSLARLGGLGIGQAKYIGQAKTRFQLSLCATVANLRRTWNYSALKNRSQAVAAAA